jgi:hypothetical protein
MRVFLLSLLLSGVCYGQAPEWTLLQHASTRLTPCSTSSLTCAITLPKATAASSVFTFDFRCGSAVQHNECHPTSVELYTGTASGGTCSGVPVHGLTIDQYARSTPTNPANNAALGHTVTSSTIFGAHCLQVTRNNTCSGSCLDISAFALDEWSYGTGGSPALDGVAMLTDVVPSGSTETGWTYEGQSLTLTGRNDIVMQVCACGGDLMYVSSPWTGDFIDHFASAYLGNIPSFTAPEWTTGTDLDNSATGVVGAIAITD